MAPDASDRFTSITEAAKALERAVLEAGGLDIQIRVHAERYLPELVRDGDGDAEVVHRLDGCDPRLWTVHRPEGAFTLGRPFAQDSPTCALSGRTIDEPAPLGIYFHGHPVAPEATFHEAPLLVHLWALALAVEGEIERASAGGPRRPSEGVWRRLIELFIPNPTGGKP